MPRLQRRGRESTQWRLLFGMGLAVRHEPARLALIVALAGAMWLAALHAVYDAFWVTLKASSRGLESRSLLGRARLLPWESVMSVS